MLERWLTGKEDVALVEDLVLVPASTWAYSFQLLVTPSPGDSMTPSSLGTYTLCTHLLRDTQRHIIKIQMKELFKGIWWQMFRRGICTNYEITLEVLLSIGFRMELDQCNHIIMKKAASLQKGKARCKCSLVNLWQLLTEKSTNRTIEKKYTLVKKISSLKGAVQWLQSHSIHRLELYISLNWQQMLGYYLLTRGEY